MLTDWSSSQWDSAAVRAGRLPVGRAGAGEWMTSGHWRQSVWGRRVRSTQLGWPGTHSWLKGAFLHKNRIVRKGKIRPNRNRRDRL